MPDENNTTTPTDLIAARRALRAALLARGHIVASDTMSATRDLYVVGPNDLAKALFVFDDDAEEAAMTMYRSSGSWVTGMPPRFAVLPASQSSSASFELLEQIRAIPLLFDVDGGCISFRDLDRLLAENIDA